MEGNEKLGDIYKVTRGQIEHINNMLAQRVIWMVIAQSFFFGAYVNLVCGLPKEPHLLEMQKLLLMIFPIASVATVAFSYIDIIISLRKLVRLKEHYVEQKQQLPDNNGYPPLDGVGKSFLENAVPILVPVVFIIAWVCVLIKWS